MGSNTKTPAQKDNASLRKKAPRRRKTTIPQPGVPQEDYLLSLQRTIGNMAVGKLISSRFTEPHTVARKPGPKRKRVKPPSKPKPAIVVPEKLETPGQLGDILTGGGVKKERLGDLVKGFDLPNKMSLLADLATPTGANMVPGWNRGVDDLTLDHYPTLLHFLDELNRLSLISMGEPRFVDAVKKMPHVRLAGITDKMNPRVLFFAAAAQVQMDIKAGVTEGEGHFMAVPAMSIELKQIGEDAKAFIKERTTGKGKKKTRQPEGASLLYDHLVARLNRVIERVTGEKKQLEPGVKAYLEKNASLFKALPKPANDEEAFDALGVLAGAIGKGPGRGVLSHGYGTIGDFHSTMHAIGLAFDLFYSRKGGPTNLMSRSKQYFPFISYLIAEFEGGKWPSEPADLTPILVDHGEEGKQRVIEGGAPKDQAREVQEYRALLIKKIASPLRRVKKAVLSTRPTRKVDIAVRSKFNEKKNAALAGLESAIALMPKDYHAPVPDPESVKKGLESAAAVVGDLLAALPEEGVWRKPLVASKEATSILELSAQLEGINAKVHIQERRLKVAKVVKTKGFEKWLAYVTNPENAMADQPFVISEGMKTEVAKLQGWHHWQVGGGGTKYDVTKDYKSALLADMKHRKQDQMARILTLMAETEAGRQALWGDWKGEGDPSPGKDEVLRAALAEWAENLSPDKPVGVPGLLKKAHSSVSAAVHPQAKGLVASLIAQGYYSLANSLVKGDAKNTAEGSAESPAAGGSDPEQAVPQQVAPQEPAQEQKKEHPTP